MAMIFMLIISANKSYVKNVFKSYPFKEVVI